MIHLKLTQFKKLAAKFRSQPLDLEEDGGLRKIQTALDELSAAGITVFLIYGPFKEEGIFWEGRAQTEKREEFYTAKRAGSLKEIVGFVYAECQRRGWVTKNK